MDKRKCVICQTKFKIYGTKKTCSKECSEKLTKLTRKRYFANPKIHKKHIKIMREYANRPDIKKKEKIRKSSPAYLEYSREYQRKLRLKNKLLKLK